MDLFGRYVFRQAGAALLLILVTLTAIVWLGTALRELDLVTSKGQGLAMFLQITLFALPNLIGLIAPNALLLAVLYTLDRLNGDSELIVMTSSGAPVWRLATPLFLLAGIVTVALVVINFWLMPASLQAVRGFVTQVRTDLIAQVMRPGRFTSPEPALTFHIRDRAPNGDLVALMVHDERDDSQVMTYFAKRGQTVEADGGAYLVMRDGEIHRVMRDKPQDGAQIVAFEQYIFDISQLGPKTATHDMRPRERYLGELLWPDTSDPYYQNLVGQFRAELHNRFATLLYPAVFTMVALMLLGQARTVRQGRWSSLIAAFAICVLLRVAGLAATNLLVLQAWAVVLVYGIPLGAILVAALSANARMVPRRRFGRNFELPFKLWFDNEKFRTAWGLQAGRRGRVG